MKKLLLFFMSFFTIFSYSQFEGFEGATFPPTGWTRFDNGIGLAQQWNETTSAALVYAGSKAAFLNREDVVSGSAEDWLVTSQMLIPANGQLRFYTKLTQAGDQGSSYTIRVSTTSQTNTATFTTVRTWSELQIMDDDDLGDSGSTLAQQSTYIQKKVNLSAYAGQNVYIAFVMTNDNGDRWAVDNVNIDQQCLVSTALTATPLSTSALLSWTSTNTGPWEIEYGLVGFTPGTGTIVSVPSPTSSFNLTGLQALTEYTFYVRSLCSADNIGPWSTGFDFTTSALPPICGGNFVDDGGVTGNYPNNQDYIVTICPNPGEYVTVDFTSFFTEASWDKLYVYDGNSTSSPQISSGNGGGFGTVTLPGAFWGNLNANLPGPFEATSTSGCLTFRFVSDGFINNPGWTANITCQPFPSCPKPTNITAMATSSSSIVVNWTNNAPAATQWEVIWVPAGSPAPLATATGQITTNSSTYTINGLDSATAYDIYVRAICAAGTDVGPWSTVHGTASTNPNYCAGDHFYDLGGPSGNYPNNVTVANGVTTICPSPGEVVTVYFNSFDLSSSVGDALTIYDGDNTSGTVVGTYFGTNVISSYTSTSPTGCLTFSFVSNGSQNAAGWDATIVCGPPCPAITSVLNSTIPAVGSENIIRICPGASVEFNGSGTFAGDGTGAAYEWDFDDGSTATGTSATHTFASEGIYLVNLTIIDANGCRNNNKLNQKVYVSTTPIFTGTVAYDDEICLGQSTTITGVSVPVQFIKECAPPVSGTTFLPDGSGISYLTTVPVDCFPFGSTITSASQITSVCIDMEHSYLGDLELRLVSPNGQSIILKAYNGTGGGGGGTYLGCAIDGGAGPGTGRTYCFTPTATTYLVNGTTSACGTPSSNSINAGNYMPVQPFTNLIGSQLNGNWSLIVTDNLLIDDGYIFSWGINFDNSILPTDYAFTPTIDSSNWTPDPAIVATSGNTITVTPTTVGTNCYTYNVTDNFGCTYSEQVCIEVLAGVSLTDITATSPICLGDNGTFTLTGSPNTTVSYNFDGGASQTVTLDGTGNAIISLTGLTASTTLNSTHITAPAIPTSGNVISTVGGLNPNNSVGTISAVGATANTTNCTTVNATNPTLTMTLANELPPGTPITVSIARNNNAGSVTISDGVNSQIFNLGPNNILQHVMFTTGTFTSTITITRNNGNTYVDGISYTYNELGCDAPLSMSETLVVNPVPAVNIVTHPASICSGNNAQFIINGTPNTDVTYTINGGANQLVTLNSTGQGSVSVSNANSDVTLLISQAQIGSCTTTLSITETIVVNPVPFLTSLTANSPICSGQNAIFSIVGTPNASVMYSINGQVSNVVVLDGSGQGQVIFSNATSNTTMTLSDINNGACNFVVSNFETVIVNPVPAINIVTHPASICSGNNAQFIISGTPNTDVTYTINGGANQLVTLNSTGQGSVSVSNASSDVILLISQAQIGSCTTTLSITETIVVNPVPFLTSLTANSPICSGQNAIFSIVGTPNASVMYSINGQVSDVVVLDGSGQGQVIFSNATSNTTMTLSDINNGACNFVVSNFETVIVNPVPSTPSLTTVTESVCIGDDIIFNVSGTANSTVSYTINGGATQILILDGSGNGIITILSASLNTLVELQDVTDGMCNLVLSISEDVIVESCTIQKGISPNNDGLNDNFDLSGYNVSKLEIFNRYGTVVYSKSGYEDEWYGQSDNGNELPDGTYYYVIDFSDDETKTGWIYINREQ